MSNIIFDDVTSVLQYGLESQNKIAKLNQLASARIRERNFDELTELMDELLFMAGDADIRSLADKERHIEEYRSRLSRERMELLKEARLQQALREVNDSYALQIGMEIQEAKNALEAPTLKNALDVHSKTNVLRKRIQELSLSKTVAESFSEQLRLTQEQYSAMAERTWSVLTQMIPLLRGRVSMDASKLTISEARRMLRDHLSEAQKLQSARLPEG